MIIINKKRMKMIVACLLIGIFSFTLQVVNHHTNEEKQNTVMTTATPVSGKTIIIDAGHGVPDERSRK